MPPKKKQQPRNAFYYFMLDWKAGKEKQGQRFKDLKEVSELCSDDWKVIPQHMLTKYKAMEKTAKGKDKNDKCNKYNSLGVPFTQIENEQQQELAAKKKMNDDTDDILASISASRDLLMDHCFYLVHSNVYCYWGQERVYIPCEVAISKFNLKLGVVDTYHVFPAPHTKNADIPLGYKFQVRQNSEQVHEIPEPSEFSDKLEYDWKKIRSDIHHFLRPDGGNEIPPLFTMDMDDSNTNCYITAVKNFFDIVTDDSTDDFRVYSLTLLFFKLYDLCQQIALKEFQDHERAFPVEGVAHQQLMKDIYNFCPGIACTFHESTDHYNNCSLSFVKRWVFLICEFCCSALRIELIPGRHCLANAKVSVSWNSEPPRPQLQPDKHPKTAPVTKPSEFVIYDSSDDESNEGSDGNGAWSTVPSKVQQKMTSLKIGETNAGTNGGGAWKPMPGVQAAWGSKVAVDQNEPLFVDYSKNPDPSQTRILRTGQSPYVVSEIKPDIAPLSVRLPTTRGRGELMARALSLQQSTPGASFSAEDFPEIGASKPGHVNKPVLPGWGRGFMKQ